MTAPSRPQFWCNVCCLDLQSSASLAQHKTGRKHRNRAFQLNSQIDSSPSFSLPNRTTPLVQLEAQDRHELDDSLTDFFRDLATGRFQKIVVCTGAGVSTAAGVPDFRSDGGLFETLRRDFGDRFPEARHNPEWLLSRSFAVKYPEVWNEILVSRIQKDFVGLEPTVTHKFCAWLHRRGWLQRVYTQNVDGLHIHPSLNLAPECVVECHGSMRDASLVLYDDDLPSRFGECCNEDFPLNADQKVDLMLVMGTSLQVAPFCGVPNMALKGCTRVLVNRRIQDCLRNDFSPNAQQPTGLAPNAGTHIGSRKNVPLRPLWNDRKANKRWSQLLVESDCDEFVSRFFQSTTAIERGYSLEAQ